MKRNEELWNKVLEQRIGLMYDSAVRETANIRAKHASLGTLHGTPFVWEITNLVFETFSKIKDHFAEAYIRPYETADSLSPADKNWLLGKLDDVFRVQSQHARGLIQDLCRAGSFQPKDIQPQLSEFEVRAVKEVKQYLLREIEIIFLKHKEKQVSEESPPLLLQLPNRDVLFSDLAVLFKKGPPILSAIFIDLDGFKPLNDKLGHATGDRCLEAVVACVGSIIVNKGKLYRYGGDEFVVVLRNFNASEAMATGERIRKTIDEANLGGEVKCSASIGVACSSDLETNDGKELINAADQAMYLSKANGKNRVTLWQGSP